MENGSNAKERVENPKAHFAEPKDVIQDDTLSLSEKKNALYAWEQDERQLLTASNEGMSGSDEGFRSENDNRLGDVILAEETIGEKPTDKPSQ